MFGRFEDPVPASSSCPAPLPLAEVACTTVFLGLLAGRGLGQSGHVLSPELLVLSAFVTLATFDRLLRQAPARRQLAPRISR